MFGKTNVTQTIIQIPNCWDRLPRDESEENAKIIPSFIVDSSYEDNDPGYLFFREDDNSWIIQIYRNGKLEIPGTPAVDIFAVGAGGNGGIGGYSAGSSGAKNGGNGGGGGASCSIKNINFPEEEFSIQVGEQLDTKLITKDSKYQLLVPKGMNNKTSITAASKKYYYGISGTAENIVISGFSVENSNVVKKDGYRGGKGGSYYDPDAGGDGSSSAAQEGWKSSEPTTAFDLSTNFPIYAFDEIEFKRLTKTIQGDTVKDEAGITYGGGGGGGGAYKTKTAGAVGSYGGGTGATRVSNSSVLGFSPEKPYTGAGAGGNFYGSYNNDNKNQISAKGSCGIIIIRSHKEPVEAQVTSRAANALATSDLEALWQRINELETELTALKESNTTPEESNPTETNQEDNLND